MICGRETKTRSIWTFRGNVFVKAIFKNAKNISDT